MLSWPRPLLQILCLLLSTRAPAQQGAYTARVDGVNAGDRFGTSLAITSDSAIAPDGLPDLLVGAPYHDWGGSDAGRISWFSLSGGVPIETDRVDGGTGQYWGDFSLSSGADLDHDGWEEVLYNYGTAGRILSGGLPHTVMHSFGFPEDRLWFVGDFDGDATPDIGAYYDSGSSTYLARCYSGAAPGTLLFSMGSTGGYLQTGYHIADGGDLNRDGFAEILVAEAAADNQWLVDTGCIYALAGAPPGYGGAELWRFYGEKAGDRIEAVANVGDWNGDLVDDVAVGSPRVDVGALTDAGRVYILSGADGAEIARLDGFAASLLFGGGRSMVSADLTGDGRRELIVGLPSYSPNGRTSAGAVRVYEWSGSGLTMLFGADGDAAGDQFGAVVAASGDLDGDGIVDFAASSPYADPSGKADAGSVFVFSGFAAGGPWLVAQPDARPGDSVPVTVLNATPGHYVVLLASPNLQGASLFGHVFEVGQPIYVVAVGGKVPSTGQMTVTFDVPSPFPVGLPITLHLEGMLLDPWGVPYGAVSSTNSLPLLIH